MARTEKIGHAVEHGCLAQARGFLDVRRDVRQHPGAAPAAASLTLVWKETGYGGLAEPARRGFGTEVLTETLAYAPQAVTALAYEPDGLRCTIRYPLPERIGPTFGDEAPA